MGDTENNLLRQYQRNQVRQIIELESGTSALLPNGIRAYESRFNALLSVYHLDPRSLDLNDRQWSNTMQIVRRHLFGRGILEFQRRLMGWIGVLRTVLGRQQTQLGIVVRELSRTRDLATTLSPDDFTYRILALVYYKNLIQSHINYLYDIGYDAQRVLSALGDLPTTHRP